MHIPDGYLSPQTCGVMYAVMAPLWYAASRVAKRSLKAKQVPYLALSAAFVFVIMMFNVPVPGGTTGHAVGGTLAAVLLGPWAAMIALTVALVVQALLFGDGGILAVGANCFNLAFVLPFVGYYLYRAIAMRSAAGSVRRAFAAAAGAYVGIVAASLTTAVMFGVQPLLHHTADGKPLYCPYGLGVAVPIMLFEHAVIFGWIEAAVTFLVIRYLQKQDPSLIAGCKEAS